MDSVQAQFYAWLIVLTDLLWLLVIFFFVLGVARTIQVIFRQQYKDLLMHTKCKDLLMRDNRKLK